MNIHEWLKQAIYEEIVEMTNLRDTEINNILLLRVQEEIKKNLAGLPIEHNYKIKDFKK